MTERAMDFNGVPTEVVVRWRDGAWYSNDIATLESCTRELHQRGADPSCTCSDTTGHAELAGE